MMFDFALLCSSSLVFTTGERQKPLMELSQVRERLYLLINVKSCWRKGRGLNVVLFALTFIRIDT